MDVYDQNYALVIVTQQKKKGISNPIGQRESVFVSILIYKTMLYDNQKFSVKIFGWISARMLCVCV